MIPVNEPLLTGNEKKYLADCIDSGWISSEGPFVKAFERQFAQSAGRDFGIAVSSGSAALDIAVRALGLGPGDEVILPAFTIISCAAAIVRCGATPVVVDCEPATWNIDVTAIEDRITSKTRAIMAVHIYGHPSDMDPILAVAKKHRLFVIEDAAEAHGQTYKSRPCGSFGDISTFSFYANKHITTGEGGMIVTDRPPLFERCCSLRNLCFKAEQRFVHDEIGWNYRMTSLQAALGLAQLERLDEFIRIKRRMGSRYLERLRDCPQLRLPQAETDYSENTYWVFPVVIENGPFTAADVMAELRQRHIGARPFFYPIHRQPAFNKIGLFAGESHPVAERVAEKGFYLPSGLALTEAQIESVASILKEVLSA